MKTWKQRRTIGATVNTEPTLTDQAGAATTDLNIIVNQFLKTGQGPRQARPIYADFTGIATDLRGIIEQSRSVQKLRRDLPPQLREMPTEELLGLTPEQIQHILTPPAPTPEPPKEPTK